MSTQKDLADQLLAIRDQLVKVEHEVKGKLAEKSFRFDVTWSITPILETRPIP